jgi:hypothetical protein
MEGESTDLSSGDNVGLRLNRSCTKEDVPVRRSSRRSERGGVRDDLCSFPSEHNSDFGESEVVTSQKTD